MARNVKDLLAEANSSVPRLSPSEAAEKMRAGEVLVVDVRDPTEVQQTGKLKGAINVSRGMLEFRADPESQYHNLASRLIRRRLQNGICGLRGLVMSGPWLMLPMPMARVADWNATRLRP